MTFALLMSVAWCGQSSGVVTLRNSGGIYLWLMVCQSFLHSLPIAVRSCNCLVARWLASRSVWRGETHCFNQPNAPFGVAIRPLWRHETAPLAE